MKILVVPSWYPPFGGRFFRMQAEALAEKGHQVDVLVLNEKGITQKINSKIDTSQSNLLKEYRFTYHRIPLLNKINIELYIKKYKKLLKNYLQKNRPDIIHIHSAIWAGVAVVDLAKKYNIPYVISEHKSLFFEPNINLKLKKVIQIRKTFDSANVIIAVSEAMKKSLHHYTNKEIVVVPNMVNTDFFKLDKKLKHKSFTFISVGNLIDVKGFDILLKAFKGLCDYNRNIYLKIIGEGKDLDKLKAIAQQLDISVEFCNYKSREELLLEYQTAAVFVSSSRKETFGVSIIEAMSCGLPVVATKSGGPEDIVNDDNGYLAEVNNANSLQFQMQRMLDNYSNFDAEKIRQNVISKYSKNVVVNQLESVLKNVYDSKSN